MTDVADDLNKALADTAAPRLVRFCVDGPRGGVVVGLLSGSQVDELDVNWERALENWALGSEAGAPTGRTFALTQGSCAVPADESSRGLFCVGMNYRAHQAEVDSTLGSHADGEPVIFSKVPESLLADGEPLGISAVGSTEFDWEVELGVVIGRRGRFVPAEESEAYVAGYTLVNDITARDVQRAHSQWFLGKNVHRATPVGPSVVRRGALGWPPDGRLRLTVNGEVKQDANTIEMVHGVPKLIEVISRFVELRVGDIIATGSPAGVGFTRNPPEFLAEGDVVRAELVGIFALQNEVT